MKRSPAPADPGGPALLLCAGHRCSALLRRSAQVDHEEQLRRAIRATRGAVMLSTGCVQACALAPVAAVARRGGTDQLGPAVWLAGLDNPERSRSLQDWIRAGGPSGSRPQQDLPAGLTGAVLAVAPPTTMSRSSRR